MISIIVPVYNAEKYLDRCLTNLVGQTYKDIEIILINDGSKDKSLEIGQKWAQKDARIRIIDQANSGVSAARNAGIKAAKGEYIMFCDADDWYELNTCEVVANKIEDFDCLAFNLKYHGKDFNYENLPEQIINLKNQKDKILNGYKKGIFFMPVWNKAYKAKIIKNILFDTNYFMSEDWLFNIEVFKNINEIKIIDDVLYNYFIANEDSATKNYKPNMINNYIDVNKANDDFFRDCKAWNRNEEMLNNFVVVLGRNKILKNKKYFISELKRIKNMPEIAKIRIGDCATIKKKGFYLLLKMRLYGLIYKLVK